MSNRTVYLKLKFKINNAISKAEKLNILFQYFKKDNDEIFNFTLSTLIEENNKVIEEKNKIIENHKNQKIKFSQLKEEYKKQQFLLNKNKEDYKNQKNKFSQVKEDFQNQKIKFSQVKEDFQNQKIKFSQLKEEYKKQKFLLNKNKEDYKNQKIKLSQLKEDYKKQQLLIKKNKEELIKKSKLNNESFIKFNGLNFFIEFFHENPSINNLIYFYERLSSIYPKDKNLLSFLIKSKLIRGDFEELHHLFNYVDKLQNKNLSECGDNEFLFCENLIRYKKFHKTKNQIYRETWLNSFVNCNIERKSASDNIKVNYIPFQYWSQGELPEDLLSYKASWNKIFRDLGLPEITLFDKKKARDWIEEFCPELSTPFNTAFHYCVESDVFRVAYASRNNCIYLDSDCIPKPKTFIILRNLLNEKKDVLASKWHRLNVSNNFFITRKNSKFFNKIISDMSNYDFNKTDKNRKVIMHSFGPQRYSLTAEELLMNEENLNLTFLHHGIGFGPKPKQTLSYYKTDNRWQNLFE